MCLYWYTSKRIRAGEGSCAGKLEAEQFLRTPKRSLGSEVFQLVLQGTDARVLGTNIPAITIVTRKYNNRALFLEHFSYQLYPPTFSRVNDLGVSSIWTLRFKEKGLFFFF